VEPVLVEVGDQRMYITLNRPEVLNAQNQPMRDALVAALDRFEADDDLRVAVLSGAGRAFSAGADLKEIPDRPHGGGGGRAGSRGGERSWIHFDRIWHTDKPVIAALHGYAVGGGFELAQLCDIRIATADALLGQPEPRTIGGIGGIAIDHLHHLIPRGEAMLIHLTAEPITGERAYQIGLVQRVVADQPELRAAADALADSIVKCSPAALTKLKQSVRANIDPLIAR
jgi:enoyl-CoA hydratase/carnithine racemase